MSWEDCYKSTSCRPVKWRMWILQCASQVLLLYLQLPYPWLHRWEDVLRQGWSCLV